MQFIVLQTTKTVFHFAIVQDDKNSISSRSVFTKFSLVY